MDVFPCHHRIGRPSLHRTCKCWAEVHDGAWRTGGPFKLGRCRSLCGAEPVLLSFDRWKESLGNHLRHVAAFYCGNVQCHRISSRMRLAASVLCMKPCRLRCRLFSLSNRERAVATVLVDGWICLTYPTPSLQRFKSLTSSQQYTVSLNPRRRNKEVVHSHQYQPLASPSLVAIHVPCI